MRKSEKLKYMEDGAKIWNALKALDRNNKMPADMYQEWK